MNAQELRKKSTTELKSELSEVLREQFNLRLQQGFDKAAVRPHNFKRVRRDISRLRTILHEKASEL